MTTNLRKTALRARHGALTAILAALVAAPPAAGAQDPDSGTAVARDEQVRAVPVQGRITVDGRLDEPAWREAEAVTDFVQRNPAPGEPASERTEVRVLHDEGSLYVGMRLYDENPDGIAAQLGRRGSTDLHSDWAHVLIDSYHDRRTAFRFSLSPAGVKKDALHYDDVAEDDGWDAVWEAAATVDSLGWTAEFRIPLSQLRFTLEEGETPVWGINFMRDVARRDERSVWAPVPPGSDRFVSRFGTLHGLERLQAPRRLEVMPYTLARGDRSPGDGDDPFVTSGRLSGDVGLDVSYGLGPNLTLTGTVNPDFGQVEVDPAVVNLTAFETFFPERRPFFLEGADIFDFDINVGDGGQETLFYSRRIGRSPQGSVPGEAVHADVPSSTDILGAAKLSGRTRSGWSIGALNAVTDGETATWQDADGDFRRSPVEPRTNYGALRVSRDFRGGNSSVGTMATSVHRERLGDGAAPLPSEAYAAGIDGRHRFGEDRWQVQGWLAASHLQGEPEAMERVQRAPGRYFQRPDADHVSLDPARTSLTGVAGDLTLSRVAGERWRGGALVQARSPGFEANDLGFQRDRDMAVGAVWLGRVSFEPGDHLQNWNLFGNLFNLWTWGSERVFTGVNVNGSFRAISGWGGHGGVEVMLGGLDPLATRGGPALHRPSGTAFWSGLHTDRRRAWFLELNANALREHAGTGQRQLGLAPSLTIRPSPRLEASLGPRWERNRDPAQYVGRHEADGETHHLFGELDQTTISADLRLNLTFTPDLSLELFAQPFVSVGHYSAFRRVDEPRAGAFGHRYHTFEPGDELRDVGETGGRAVHGVFPGGAEEAAYTFADPGFRTRSLRGNAVLRWEFRPGSTLFLVWQQDRMDQGPASSRFDVTRDVRGIASAPGEHTLVIKATYWLGL